MSVVGLSADGALVVWECDWCGTRCETPRSAWPAPPPPYTVEPECGPTFRAFRLNPAWAEPQEPGNNALPATVWAGRAR